MSAAAKKWVVFDLGGVLLGWDVPLLRKYLPELEGLRDPTIPLVERFFGTPEWKAFDRGEVTAQGLADALAQREAADSTQMEEIVEVIRKSLVPMPEKVEYLRRLADRRDAGDSIGLGFLSNMPVPYARKLQANYEWFNWFDMGIFSGDVGVMKPDPNIFQMFADKSGAADRHHLFIDDYPHNLLPAESLGWATSHAAFERDYSVDIERWLHNG